MLQISGQFPGTVTYARTGVDRYLLCFDAHDIRNQQLYHLPLLITRIHCAFLVTFDLRNKKALDTIRRTMKHISAFVSYDAECLLRNCLPSKVFLVGTHKEKLTDSQISQFGKELHESLKNQYDDLIVKPSSDEEF